MFALLLLSRLVVCTAVWDGAAAQGPRRSLGVVTGSIHLPRDSVTVPQMIHVTLSTITGSFVARVTLNQELAFRFHNIPNGNYILRVEAQGHQPAERPIEMSSYMQREETFVVMTLGPPIEADDPALPPAGQATISTDALAVPEQARRLLERARRESERNNPNGAIRHLRSALEVHPHLPEAYNSLAIEYLRLGKPDEARAALEKSIELDPHVATTHRNLAQLHLGERRPDEAIDALRRSLELEEESGRSLTLLGEAYLAKNQHEEALEYFEKASRSDPQDHSHLGLARCYLGLGRYNEALEEFRGFLEKEPQGQRADSVRQLIARLEEELDR